jgi:hypothetical protein
MKKVTPNEASASNSDIRWSVAGKNSLPIVTVKKP